MPAVRIVGREGMNNAYAAAYAGAAARAMKLADASLIVRAPNCANMRGPFKGVGDWIAAVAWWISVENAHIAEQGSIDKANAILAQVNSQSKTALDAVWTSSQFSNASQTALATGFQLAQRGWAIGNGIVPGLGGLIGAAIGFLIGIFESIIPIQKIQFLDRWRTMVREMDPVVRYALLAQFRSLSDYGRSKEGLPLWTRWFIGNDAFHTQWEGIDVEVIFMMEILWEENPVPDSLVDDDKTFWYAAAAMVSNHPDNKAVGDMAHNGGLIRRGETAFERRMAGILSEKCGDVRATASAMGCNDFPDLPLTDGVRALLLAAQDHLVSTTSTPGART